MDFKTSDLNLAAFLKSKHDLKIRNLEPDSREVDRALFVFVIPDGINIDKLVASYYNNDDLCSINKFMHELDDLRSWLRNFRVNRV